MSLARRDVGSASTGPARAADRPDDLPDTSDDVIPPVGASRRDLEEALKAMQLQLHGFKEANIALQQDKAELTTQIPKRRQPTVPDEISAHNIALQTFARMYGTTVEMFPPSHNTLQNPQPLTQGKSFLTCERYETALTEEKALLEELYDRLPQKLHHLVSTRHFSDLLEATVSSSRSTEIFKLRSIFGGFIDLPQECFTEIDYNRLSVPEICRCLFVNPDDQSKYILFPPILFPKLKWNTSLKNIFGNWELFAKIAKAVLFGKRSFAGTTKGGPRPNGKIWGVVSCTPGLFAWSCIIAIFLLSPDKGFTRDSKVGTHSKMNYPNMFYSYKKLLIRSWDTPRLREIISKFNGFVFGTSGSMSCNHDDTEDFSAEMETAMAALDMDQGESDDPDSEHSDNSLEGLYDAPRHSNPQPPASHNPADATRAPTPDTANHAALAPAPNEDSQLADGPARPVSITVPGVDLNHAGGPTDDADDFAASPANSATTPISDLGPTSSHSTSSRGRGRARGRGGRSRGGSQTTRKSSRNNRT